MGISSWIYSDTNKQMRVGKQKKSYLLVPPEFQKEYGKVIIETCYDGYTRMGEYDVFELIAKWNQNYISPDIQTRAHKEPVLEEYGGMYDFQKREFREQGVSDKVIEEMDMAKRKEYYENGLRHFRFEAEMIKDFVNNLDDEKMQEKYGEDYLREIGILLAAYDEDNEKLHYPIKITESPMDYNSASFSRKDPDQGL